jgi:signal transduction histidine kinase
MQAVERQQSLERERARIARDMHDDLGSSLVKIAMFGERLQTESDAPETIRAQLRRIASTARHVVTAFDEIVWTVNPRNDTLENLVTYLAHYATEFFADTPVRCHLDLPIELPASPLSAETRHNLFLALKEALNNVLKHSRASDAWLHVDVRGGVLRIRVRDNGRGLDPVPHGRPGSGLSNLTSRMTELGGQFELEDLAGQGTQLTLAVPLPHPVQ